MGKFSKNRNVGIGLLIAVACAAWILAIGGGELLAGDDQTYEGLKLFSEVIELVEKNYVDPVESKTLIEGALKGMIQSLDPHSTFMGPEDFEELQTDTQGEFGGLGIVISMKDGMLTVIAPIQGTPADRAGIESGDKILKVDGESTKNMKLWEAVKKMRGPKGTSVTISTYRKGFKKPKEITLVRDIIPIESVYHAMLEPGFGYVRITSFRDHTTRDLTQALEEMESGNEPLKGLILDLRNNPGGLMSQSVSVADLFVESGELVSIKGRDERHTKAFHARRNRKKREYPIVLLINSGSASASEIVAGALQDHKRALLIGTDTFGKASVQSVEPLRNGYGVKLTIARYYTPSGRSIQAEGIKPDIVVPAGYGEVAPVEKLDQGIKEKDLENHLEPEDYFEEDSEGETGGEKEVKPAEPTEPAGDTSDTQSDDGDEAGKYGKPTPERLLKDHQVARGLEILKGHVILSKP